ncbi:MAG: M48 family metalloprotease [Cyclobacteriaceae bacterium]
MCQYSLDYELAQTYDHKSGALKNVLRNQMRRIIEDESHSSLWKTNELLRKNTDFLIELIDEKLLIKNDILTQDLFDISSNISDALEAEKHVEQIFILKSPLSNAMSIGEGSLVITTGLLSGLDNIGELTFVLAHEFAHYELGHTVQSARYRGGQRKWNTSLRNFMNNEITLKDFERLKDQIYQYAELKRESEIQADSIAIEALIALNFNHINGINALKRLDSSFVTPFNSDELFEELRRIGPFWNEQWIVSGNKSSFKGGRSVFAEDSVATHLSIRNRITDISTKYGEATGIKSSETDNFLTWEFKDQMRFESADGAFSTKNYDLALFKALELKCIYPNNRFVTALIVKILIEVHRIKNTYSNEILGYLIPQPSSDYTEQLRNVNTFIKRIQTAELAEFLYLYLNRKEVFDSSYEEHYYLLWKLADITDRQKAKKSIREVYLTKFEEPIYKSEMSSLISKKNK